MACVNDYGKLLLGAILRGATVWSAPADLAIELGWDIDETTDRLAELDATGWIEVWERPREIVVTLSSLGAERLGVRMVEHGRSLTPRWLAINEPEPPPPRASGVFLNARAMELEFVLDTAPSPDEQAEIAEETIRLAARSSRRPGKAEPPKPSRFIGQGLSPWPGPEAFTKPPCPACGGRLLTPVEYCLGCDRWGLDPASARNRTVPSPETAQALALLEQKDQRDRRKARMRRRLERLEEDRRAGSRRRA
ncbi:MAG: hypothetical protein NVSMB14_17660 [Isosphaeraceae bacterium]